MKIILPKYSIETKIDKEEIYQHIEKAGRTCYKSEDKITENSSKKFIKKLINSQHESVLEHKSISIRFVCNRGFSHEMVRHRLASFSQESTRYCTYSKNKFSNGITVIKPCWLEEDSDGYEIWLNSMKDCERSYLQLIAKGYQAQQARGVLPIDLKTEIVVTANIREWRHILKLRCDVSAHPSMRELMIPLYKELNTLLPELFEDLNINPHNRPINSLKYSNEFDYTYKES